MCNHSEEVIPVEERKWNDILACQHFRGHTFEAEVSKLLVRLVRHCDQDEREADGTVHWKSIGPKLRKAFQKAGGHKFSGSDCSIFTEATKLGSSLQTFQRRPVHSCYSRAHWERTRQIGHIAIPQWKEFLFHGGIAGEGKEGKPSSSHLHSRTIQMNLATTRSREKLTTAIGNLVTTSTGSFYLARQRTAVLANQMSCHYCMQLCAGRLHLQSELFLKDSGHLGLRQR